MAVAPMVLGKWPMGRMATTLSSSRYEDNVVLRFYNFLFMKNAEHINTFYSHDILGRLEPM